MLDVEHFDKGVLDEYYVILLARSRDAQSVLPHDASPSQTKRLTATNLLSSG